MLTEARSLALDHGISVFPAERGGKRPAFHLVPTWEPYQKRLPTTEELEGWYGRSGTHTLRGRVSGGAPRVAGDSARQPITETEGQDGHLHDVSSADPDLRLPGDSVARSVVLEPPALNLAVVGGAVSLNLVVLDFDDITWAEDFLANEHLMGRSWLVETPRGGRHLYLRTDKPVGCGGFGVAMQVKGEGGYVIAPPSWNEGRQGYYGWLQRDMLAYVPAEALRKALSDLCERMGYEDTAKPGVRANAKDWITARLSEGAVQGARHSTLVSLGGYLRTRLPCDIAGGLLVPWGAKCDPPLTEDEVRREVEDIYRRYGEGAQAGVHGEGLAPNLRGLLGYL